MDAITTDRALEKDELAILNLLKSANSATAPEAAACFCKLALAVDVALVPFPVDLRHQVAQYIEKISLVNVECRLTEEEEFQLLDMVVGRQIKQKVVDDVAKQANSTAVMDVASGKKSADGVALIQAIQSAAAAKNVRISANEISTLISNRQGASPTSQVSRAFTVLSNRRKQLRLRVAAQEVDVAEDGLYDLPQVEALTGSLYQFVGADKVLHMTWGSLSLKYRPVREITSETLSTLVRLQPPYLNQHSTQPTSCVCGNVRRSAFCLKSQRASPVMCTKLAFCSYTSCFPETQN